jgi:hypothetical protein
MKTLKQTIEQIKASDSISEIKQLCEDAENIVSEYCKTRSNIDTEFNLDSTWIDREYRSDAGWWKYNLTGDFFIYNDEWGMGGRCEVPFNPNYSDIENFDEDKYRDTAFAAKLKNLEAAVTRSLNALNNSEDNLKEFKKIHEKQNTESNQAIAQRT